MIYQLKSDVVQGIDLVIARYQERLFADLGDGWDIYPRLERLNDEWKYFTGEDYEKVQFSETSNVIGFGVSNEEDLGNQHQCTLTLVVSFKETTKTRDIQALQNAIRMALRCTFQTTRCDIGSFTPDEDAKAKHPHQSFILSIQAKYISFYKVQEFEYARRVGSDSAGITYTDTNYIVLTDDQEVLVLV